MTAVGSGGSVENVKRVSRNESNIGMCYAVDSALGWAGKLPKDSKQVPRASGHGLSVWRSRPADRARGQRIKSAYDLKGKRVAVGNAGSGAAASAERFFRHIGVGQVQTHLHGLLRRRRRL
jgi:TRAP-type uncharacterized transport system substrate-binding protein